MHYVYASAQMHHSTVERSVSAIEISVKKNLRIIIEVLRLYMSITSRLTSKLVVY